jgi:hypothetical protein
MVTIQNYRKLIADHPRKFTEAEVGFEPHPEQGLQCGGCFHFYSSIAADRNVCEIYRAKDGSSIPEDGHCAFWTKTGKRFPLLVKTEPPPKKKEAKIAVDS